MHDKYAILILFVYCNIFSFTTSSDNGYQSYYKKARDAFHRKPLSADEQFDSFFNTFASSGNDGLKFLNILLNYFPNYTSPQCRTDLTYTLDAQKNYTISQQLCVNNNDCVCEIEKEIQTKEYGWIKTLIDSYGKKGSYVEQGNIFWMGGYRECLSVSSSSHDDSNGQFQGRYCLLSAVQWYTVQQEHPCKNSTLVPLPMHYGVCIPRSCFAGNIEGNQMSLLFDKLKDFTINFTLTCHDNLDLSKDVPAISMLTVCALFAFVLLLATSYDLLIYQRKLDAALQYSIDKKDAEDQCYSQLGLPLKILLTFSVYSNAVRVLDTDRTVGQLDCIHGIRFISMTWVVLGHTYFFGAGVLDNLLYVETVLYSLTEQTILNATYSVDTFFVLSGCLLAYLWLKETEKKSGKNLTSPRDWILYYVSRFIRLTPPYMLIMGLDITLFRYLTDGPMWPQNGVENNYCKASWWQNLLYINNWFDMNDQCFGWSWFLANDMQFYWISPLVLIPLWLLPWLGISLSVVIVIGSSLANGLMTYLNNYPPNQIDIFMNGKQFNSVGADDVYSYPFTRAGPFFIGIILGFLIFKYQGKKLRLNQLLVVALWCSAAAMNLAVLYGLYNVARGATIMNKVACAIYAGVARSVWGLGVAWVIFACVTGNGGAVNKFLSWRLFLPLSRLTYCAYLIHPLVLMATYYSRQTALHFDSDYTMIFIWFGNLVVAYSVAFIATMAFESPVLGLMKILFSKKTNEKS